MLRIERGEVETSGDYGELLADVMTMCDAFIKETMDEFKVRESKAINAFSKMTEIVKDNFHEFDEEKSMEQICEFFDYLTEYRERTKTNVVVIEADSPEDAMEQIDRVVKDIMGMEGDE